MHFETINQQTQGDSLLSEQQKFKNTELENKFWGMTKSHARYNNYSQRNYTQEELDDLEAKLLRLAIQQTDE